MIKIAVRVDGGPNIGMGHIQRCLALSSQLKKNGTDIFFISKENKTIEKKIKQEGFELLLLETNIDLKADLKGTIDAIENRGVDALIIDSYTINEYYLKEIKKIIPLLISIDDLAVFSFPSDIVINQNIYAQKLKYQSLTGKTEFLLGPKFALLKSEYSNLGKRKINFEVKKILITLGGADFLNLTPLVLKVLDTIDRDFTITIMIGTLFNNQQQIMEEMEIMRKSVELMGFSDKFHEVLLQHDLAITGGGTTTYALAAVGTPAACFRFIGNQEQNVKALAEYGSLLDLGPGIETSETSLAKKITRLIDDYHLRSKMAKLGQALVDGKGAQRVSSEILGIFNQRNDLKNQIFPNSKIMQKTAFKELTGKFPKCKIQQNGRA